MALIEAPTRVVSPNVSLVQAVGHSLINGYGLADQTLRASSRLAGVMGSSQEWNQSISGAALATTDVDGPGGISWIWQRVGQRRYRRRAPYVTASDLVLIQYGLNDMQTVCVTGIGPAPSNTQGLAMFKNALRAAIAAFRMAAWFPAQFSTLDASIVLNGAWTPTANPATPVGKKGSGAVSPGDGWRKTTANTANAIVITIPDDFPGGAIDLVFVVDPATTTATLTASGAATGTFNLDAAGTANPADTVNTRKGLTVWRLTGVAPSNGVAQTLTVATSAITGAGGVNFAGWGIEASSPAPLIGVYDIAYCNPAGLFWGGIANSDVDTWNAGIQAVVAEFAADGSVVYIPTNTELGGIGKTGVTTLNGSHTAAVTTITVADASAFASSGVAMINPGLDESIPGNYGTEIVKYTGKTGTTLTGCSRGAYGTLPKAWDGSTVFNGATSPSNPSIRQINEAAIKNFFLDGVHLTEVGHAAMAAQADALLAPKASRRRTEAFRAGPGRVDVRCQLRASRPQIIPRSADTAVYWDVCDIDTAMMHDPSAGPRVNGVYPNGNPGSWQKIFCKSDGLYVATVVGQFEMGRAMSSGQFPVGGLRKFKFRKNGTTYLGSSGGSVDANDQNAFFLYEGGLAEEFEWRFGEYIEVLAFQGGAIGPITATVTNASANITAISSMQGLRPGMRVYGTGIPANTFILSMTATTLVMSANATATVTGPINFEAQAGAGVSANLTTALTNVATSVVVNSTAGIFVNDMIRVDDEHMLVTAVVNATTLTVTRGQDSTLATTHPTGTGNVHTGIKLAAALAQNLPLLTIARKQGI